MADLPTIQAPMAPRRVAQNPNAMPLIGSIPTAPMANMQRSVAMNPIAMPTAPQIRPAAQVSAYQPAAAAMQAYDEPGDPFTAFAQGWTNASSSRDTMAQEAAEKLRVEAEAKAARDQAAAMIREQFPGQESLARGVEIGAFDADSALRQASDFSEKQSATSAAASEAAQIESYLRETGRDDLAEQYVSGVLDVDGVAAALQAPKASDRPVREDANGVPRFVDDGAEVFPGVTSNPASKPPTDAQRKANSLFTVVEPDANLLLGDGTTDNPGIFNDLGDGGSQVWNAIGASPLVSPNFQAGKDAVTSIAQNYLYAMSGAAAPAEEVKKIADLVTPGPGDSQQRKDEKRRRLQSYVDAIESSTIPAPMTENATVPIATAPSAAVDASDAPPEGVDPEDWQFMSPEDRALWQ